MFITCSVYVLTLIGQIWYPSKSMLSAVGFQMILVDRVKDKERKKMRDVMKIQRNDHLSVGNLTKIPTYEKQNKQRKHTPKKTITRTRQYLRGSAICLRPQSCRDFTIK